MDFWALKGVSRLENKDNSRDFRVLFIYYNPRKMSLVPASIAIFSSLLKSISVDVRLFDTSLYNNQKETDADASEEKNLTVKPFSEKISTLKDRIKYKTTDMLSDLESLVSGFKPDLLAVTAVESTFEGSIGLLKSIRKHSIPTILGGVFATFAPEIAISYPEIDMLCVGEGEYTLVELVKRMRSGKAYTGVPNLWVKNKDGSIIKNPVAPLVNLDDNPLLDIEIFEDARFYRAMAGKIYRMFPIETHRGCIFSCGFCNSPLQNKMYKEKTNQVFFRYKSISKVMEEVAFCCRLKAEYLFFWADNFFAYPQKYIDEFCERYKDFRIPFYCQSHPENLCADKISKLKEVGMQRVGIGIEHGNEKFRRQVVNRNYSNKTLIERLRLLDNFDVEYSVNNMIGFPDETPELAMDTVELNRQHKAADFSCSIFTPFHGTPLRKLAIERGYMKDDSVIAPSNTDDASVLVMPQFSQEQIVGKRRTFNMYVRFPQERWKEIEEAEHITIDGNRAWERLRKEYLATYIKDDL